MAYVLESGVLKEHFVVFLNY